MRLKTLLAGDNKAMTGTNALQDIEIVGLTADSRHVRPGFLFAALPGTIPATC